MAIASFFMRTSCPSTGSRQGTQMYGSGSGLKRVASRLEVGNVG
jgi:hypothetical protein